MLTSVYLKIFPRHHLELYIKPKYTQPPPLASTLYFAQIPWDKDMNDSEYTKKMLGFTEGAFPPYLTGFTGTVEERNGNGADIYYLRYH